MFHPRTLIKGGLITKSKTRFITPCSPAVVLDWGCSEVSSEGRSLPSEMQGSREEVGGFLCTGGHSLHTEVISRHPAVINVQNDLVVINGCADNLEKSRT